MPHSSESVTVTVLPDVLALVHIPRRRLRALSHHVVKQILTPSLSFLNITCNNIELSLFAEQSILAEFEPLARRDRHRIHRSAGSKHARARSHSFREPVEVSYDTWNVLQIDSHDDRQDKAGARVRELSAPLAEAGLSILYQSSYTSDFIFVKTSRLSHVLSRLAHAGFVKYAVDLTPQSLSTCPTGDHGDSLFICGHEINILGSDTIKPRRSTDADSFSLILQREEIPIARSESPTSEGVTNTSTPPASPLARFSSISPSVGDVQILDPPLACVGLSNASVDTWASKIIKLVAYPELIDNTISLTSSEHGAPKPYDIFDPLVPLDEGEVKNTGKDNPSFSSVVPSRPDTWSSFVHFSGTTSSPETSTSSSEDDGYLSSASLYLKSASTPSILTSSRSYPELSESPSAFSAMVHHWPRPDQFNQNVATGTTSKISSSAAEDLDETAVPFFSFTRTAEGSSLTTAVSLIAKLFPPSERHMIICPDDLGVVNDDDDDDEDFRRHSQSGGPSPVSSTMKCLQIDLQRHGLDKYGLISQFSKVLDSNGINHMYNSTFKTANLLVDKADALRAKSLLRSC